MVGILVHGDNLFDLLSVYTLRHRGSFLGFEHAMGVQRDGPLSARLVASYPREREATTLIDPVFSKGLVKNV